ncbi:MAG: aldo/keto reductase [Bacteroidales bacterium]|nr:MAG: aldo/keto reductase [Bacteroidales bacterium]
MKKDPLVQNRRNFLKNSIAGFAGAVLIPGALASPKDIWRTRYGSGKNMIFRRLGRTGLELPIISIGAGCYDKSVYQSALDAGIIHIDTSQYYYNGRHEQLVGEVLKGRKRDSYVIATSILFGSGSPEETSFADRLRNYPLDEKFEDSLRRLGLEYVDIFYMAGINSREAVLFDPFVEKMANLKKAGKTRFIGVATHQNEPEVIRAAVDAKVYDVVLSALNFMQNHREDVRNEMARAAKAGLGIIAMKTMAGVYWDKEQTQPVNTRAALKWVLNDKNVHTAIPGISTHDQLQANLSIMGDLTLSEEEKADLKLNDEPPGAGLYCRQCRRCLLQCPFQLEIPDIIRSFMYAYGYKNLALAQTVLKNSIPDMLPCYDCDSCSVICPNGIKIKERITDIARIKEIPEEFLS